MKTDHAHLKNATMAVMVTFAGSFAARATGTFLPGIYQNLFAVKATILLNTLFILAHLLFWFFFYSAYLSEKRDALKWACMLAIVGSFGVAFFYFRKLPFVFGTDASLPLFLMKPIVAALVPLAGSVFHLVFFVIFRASLSPGEKQWLGRPMGSVIAGISLFLCFHGIVLVNFCMNGELRWLAQMPRMAAVLLLVAALLIFYFYFRFYQYLGAQNGGPEKAGRG